MNKDRLNLLADKIQEIARVTSRLRDKETGCPWDVAQNFATIAPYTIEEAYEVADAIARNNIADLREELGDLLFQVVLHAEMASEAGAFDFADVAAGISAKMIRRHPHVFIEADQRTAQDQTKAWEVMKAHERAAKSDDSSALAGVAHALPALKRAQKLQHRAARVGFDWPSLDGVVAKLSEELSEVRQAVAAHDQSAIADEIGDLLFSIVNLARKLDVDAETALAKANGKFERRFRNMEHQAAQAGTDMQALSLDAQELLWQQAKMNEAHANEIHARAS